MKIKSKQWSVPLTLLVSFVMAILLLIYCYHKWNSFFAAGENTEDLVRRTAWLRRNILRPEPHTAVLPINIAYDKLLVPCYDDYGIPKGTIDITDREKLYRLFAYLQEHPSYKYVLCDISFANDFKSDYDSLLFSAIANTPRVCVSCTEDAVPLLDSISCLAHYTVKTAGTGFLQYKYTQAARSTVPVRMWQDIDGGHYAKHWWGYTRNRDICTDGIILDLPFTIESDYDSNGRKLIYNLGADLLDDGSLDEILYREKIILIGDWTENDMHDTIRIEQPGVVILYNAYLALRNGLNALQWWMIVLLLIFYWSLCFFTMMPLTALNNRFSEWAKRNKIRNYFFHLFSVGTVCTLFCALLYFLQGRYINVLALTFWFPIINTVINKISDSHEN